MRKHHALRLVTWILRPSADLVVFAAAVAAAAVWDAVYRSRFFDECYALALVFQMFSASAGFRERAGRGHFDILLTRSARADVAAWHLAASVIPGLLVWLIVGIVDISLLHRFPTGARSPAVAALICVSLLAWAGGLVLPRYGAGVLWLLVVVIVGGSGYASRVRTNAFAGAPLATELARGAGFLGAPMLLVADGVSPSPLLTASLVACAAAGAACGAVYIAGFDARLQEVR